jgi:hypothetical protein
MILENKNAFDILFYGPTHSVGNFAATYEYCNFYTMANAFGYVAMFDYGYLSEMMTRWALILSQ